jgi:MOSC domain-containing protein YiiM
MGRIVSIVYQTSPSDREAVPFRYSRTPLQSANLLADFGIEGDLKGGKHPDRQLNIMSVEHMRALGGEGYHSEFGQLGEQIAIEGLDINSLAPGTHLQLGPAAVVELRKPRTGCDWFETIQGKSPKFAQNRLGMMAAVIRSGPIQIGDEIRVLVGD